MDMVIGLIGLIVIGWIAISILPTILPFIGYAIVGLIVLVIIGKLLGKN